MGWQMRLDRHHFLKSQESGLAPDDGALCTSLVVSIILVAP